MEPMRIILACLAVLLISGTVAASAETPLLSSAKEFLVYFGTYTGKKSQGIYVSRLDVATGKLSAPELAAESPSPTFLAVHPRRATLYAVERPVLVAANEVRAGAVSAYAVDLATGKLSLRNTQSSRGAGPCHVSVDQSGRCVLVANYAGGSIAALPAKDDGSLGEATAFIQHTGSSVNKQRQQAPHAHWIDVAPDNRFAFVCDLGLDKIMIYRLDAGECSLTPNEPAFAQVKPGAGPRHMAFHPNGAFAYVINEMGNTVTVFDYVAATGALQEIQTVPTLPDDFSGNNTTSEVEVHPSGRFLYGSNRGHDSIVVYAVEQSSGRLTFVEHRSTQGKTPRNFAIDPTGQWLLAANQGTDNVVVFRIDTRTGRLTPAGQTVEVGAPVCIKFVRVK